ncbi:MAG: Na(+)-translocating NADH-quinone reductase subunit C [Bdellovibrionota bacterium]|nr:Na(+)-translocating NADH-quinone reductase subunit C [Bdellovibrionota bacterium]
MAKSSETLKTVTVAGLLCIVCSVLVAGIVVALRPQQAKNAEIDMKKNILQSAGLLKKGADVEEAFKSIHVAIVDMNTGKVVQDINPDEYDMTAANKDPELSVKIPAGKDVGGLSTRPKYAKVYLEKDDSGDTKTVILNMWSKGLWSTMYGFIALSTDLTIKGFGYYAQGETPGLGGEVDNPKWKEQWIGKKIYDNSNDVAFKVAKGQAQGEYQVDGLSGATITGNGVTSSMNYWFGEHGYQKVLETVAQGGL